MTSLTKADLQALYTPPRPRPICNIAAEIRADWQKPYFGAVPYMGAMLHLYHITDSYGLDSARSILLYFLANASTWRGPTARRIKSEIKEMLK
jgi:hypothetical protein